MVKIRVKKYVPGAEHLGLYTITEVTEETYKIIERIVIETYTENVGMQILLQQTNYTLADLMDSVITPEIVHEAINESINNLKEKKV